MHCDTRIVIQYSTEILCNDRSLKGTQVKWLGKWQPFRIFWFDNCNLMCIYIYIYIYYQLQLGLCPVAVLHKQWTIRNSNTLVQNTECVTLIQNVQTAKTLIHKEVMHKKTERKTGNTGKLNMGHQAYSSLLYQLSYPDHVSSLHFTSLICFPNPLSEYMRFNEGSPNRPFR
jgi:hypothetical protein